MSSTTFSAESTPPWLELPREITAMILKKLGAIEILRTAEKVCPTWRSVCMDPAMWRSIDMGYGHDYWTRPYDFKKLCRLAVDRSRGQLTDITISCFVINDLLLYIFERSNQLKSLKLVYCDWISGESLIQAVKRQPQLEQLHLKHSSIGTKTIEVVGRSCSNLKSFNFDGWCFLYPCRASNLVAFAVAENMKELRHLGLIANEMTNEGLQAVLDGCPHLESLDVRGCNNLELGGDFGKMCFKRIKYFRHIWDSADQKREYYAERYDIDDINEYDDIDIFPGYGSD